MRPTAAREPRYARARKNTQNQAKKTSEIENFEEDRRRKYSTFIPTNSHDYRNDGDNCIDAVSLRPKVIAPIRLLTQTREYIEQSYRGTSFQDAHQLGDRQPWRHLHQQMHVVNLHVHFHNLAPKLLGKR